MGGGCIYLKCPVAEAKPVREVKHGIRAVFEGEVGVSPHTCGFGWATGHDLWALQQFAQVNLGKKAPTENSK